MDIVEGQGAAPLRLSASREGSRLVITVEGELDLSNVSELEAALSRELQDQPEELIFDLGQLTFMDSSGISVLLRARNRAGTVILRNPSDIIRRVVVGTGLADIFRMEP